MQLPGELSGVCIEDLTDRHILGIPGRTIDLVHTATEASNLLGRVHAWMRSHRYTTPDFAHDTVQSLKQDLCEFVKETWKNQHHPTEFAGLDVALRYLLFYKPGKIVHVPLTSS